MLTSSNNPQVKHLKKLLSSVKYRRQHQEYVFETNNPEKLSEISSIKSIYTCDTELQTTTEKIIEISPDICERLSTTETAIQYFVVLPLKISKTLPAGKLILADSIQDPGNLGTIIRTAAAFGYLGLIFTPGTTDPFAPKVIRSSSGAISKLEIIEFNPALLKDKLLLAADITGRDIGKLSETKDHILILGNEAHGLSPDICNLNIIRVNIPVAVESLNVAIASAILMHALSNKS